MFYAQSIITAISGRAFPQKKEKEREKETKKIFPQVFFESKSLNVPGNLFVVRIVRSFVAVALKRKDT